MNGRVDERMDERMSNLSTACHQTYIDWSSTFVWRNSVKECATQHTNKLKGIGYVEFVKEESAEIAVKKRNDIQVGNRAVLVDFEGGKPKASYRDSEGKSYAKTNSFQNKRRRGPAM